MIIPTGGVEKALGIQPQKVYKTNAAEAINRMSRGDVVRLSKFSVLVEQARARALAQPDTRDDVVAKAREALENGNMPSAGDIAGSMINSAAEGQV